MNINRVGLLAAGAAVVLVVLITAVASQAQTIGPAEQAKRNYEAAVKRLEAQQLAKRPPAPKIPPQSTSQPVAQPTDTRIRGIVEAKDGPFPASDFLITNQWQEPWSGSTWLHLYAGAKMNPPGSTNGRPAVRLDAETTNPSGGLDTARIGDYPAPGADSALRIESVSASLVHLRTVRAGQAYTFDLSARQYV